ncbi:indolepyruvate ferredoxin oxidoreductase [Rhodobacter veldkampii DSM 11550]|uniref:Biopolymer transporter ExbD n=1 Tax=Phaeovulum veldkampii DSM 11550 TaxID=1185920 RepID=A0A2T4J6J5_9RHOB|nr:biopolymer transporter ExbD [Phaeovulum veldkampii]MBK5945216.1 indolepyruvate ferredoxin oxidoreductase [Phaeovulum veldkampii DSM 11550]PTE13485.1 biopolymer transporter ExbD [Phaeovulum veldkampii DSM 11550]TDQ58255.1 biopolymer transport protein ExbD [Phaeovulum veldkampii DSM 11550]
MFDFGAARPRRRPNLTPMIDVVFLLLVFFMLASRFGSDAVIALNAAGAAPGQAWPGPPRLVDVGPTGVSLNGVVIAPEALAGALAGLTETPADPIVLRARGAASLQDLITVMDRLHTSGFTRLVLVE